MPPAVNGTLVFERVRPPALEVMSGVVMVYERRGRGDEGCIDGLVKRYIGSAESVADRKGPKWLGDAFDEWGEIAVFKNDVSVLMKPMQ